jgi:hypothetical protein
MPKHDVIFDRLAQMFKLQGELQRDTYGSHPGDIEDPAERIQFIKDMNLALQDELHEFLAETGWKPWATSRHINEESAKGELVDAFHFFMNLCMAVDLGPGELFERYVEKRMRNIKRQEEGYDGVAGKCPKCKRALDDIAHAKGTTGKELKLYHIPNLGSVCAECYALESVGA